MNFFYTVQDSQGKAFTGNIKAENEDEAVLALQNKGYFILSIQSEKRSRKGKLPGARMGGRIGGYDLAFFGEQLATLIAGGIPLVRALSLLGEHIENRTLGKVISDVNKEVSAGGALYKALAKHPKVFDNIWVSLVQAGEMGGQLPDALRQISSYVQSQESMKSKIITALAYPAVLMTVALGVLIFFLVSIIPKYAASFRDFNIKLPKLTQLVVSTSNLISGNLLAIIVVIALAVIFLKLYLSTQIGRLNYNRFTMKLPLFGKFISNVQFERLLTTMSTLIKSGVSILSTISVLENAFVNNILIKRALKAVHHDVASGKSISVAFKNTGVFPSLITEMMWMGEEAGKLPNMINVLSKFYIERINQFVSRFSSLIDPVLILFVGGIIGIVVISLFLPVFKMTSIGVSG